MENQVSEDQLKNGFFGICIKTLEMRQVCQKFRLGKAYTIESESLNVGVYFYVKRRTKKFILLELVKKAENRYNTCV